VRRMDKSVHTAEEGCEERAAAALQALVVASLTREHLCSLAAEVATSYSLISPSHSSSALAQLLRLRRCNLSARILTAPETECAQEGCEVYNSVQTRDDSVQQDIIHRVPRSHSSITRTRASTEPNPTQTESELKPERVRSLFIRTFCILLLTSCFSSALTQVFRPLLLFFTPVPAISDSNSPL